VTPVWWSDPLTTAGLRVVQRKLGLAQTGEWDRLTLLAVRGFQRAHHMEPSGEIDEQTAVALGETYYGGQDLTLLPLEVVLERFGLDVDGLRRLQGQNGIKPTGEIDAWTAMVLTRLES
jgi:hypothetical protein